MAIEYYAEVVLKEYRDKWSAETPVEYNVRVFKKNDGVEDQLIKIPAFSVPGAGEEFFAKVDVNNLADCEVSSVKTRSEDQGNDKKDSFYFTITPKTSGTYTPTIEVRVYKDGWLYINGVASSVQKDLDDNPTQNLKLLEFKVPRQNTNSLVKKESNGTKVYQTETIPSIVVTKKITTPRMPEPLFSFNPALNVNEAREALQPFSYASCTKSWVVPYKFPRWVNKTTGQIRTHDATLAVEAVTVTQFNTGDGYIKQWQYSLFEISHKDAVANEKSDNVKTITQLISAGKLKSIWTSPSFDWASTNSTFGPSGRTAQNQYSNKTLLLDKLKAYTTNNCEELPPGTGDGKSEEDIPKPADVTSIRFNPPPHSVTRSFPVIADVWYPTQDIVVVPEEEADSYSPAPQYRYRPDQLEIE